MVISFLVRKVANSSLRREAARAEQELESLQEAMEEQQEKLNEQKRKLDKDFQERVYYFERTLKEDEEFLQDAYPLIYVYLQQHMECTRLIFENKYYQLIQSRLYKSRNNIEDWLNSTQEDIDQLERMKEAILQQSDWQKHLQLSKLQNKDFPIDNSDSDTIVLRKLKRLQSDYRATNKEYEANAVQGLIDHILHENHYKKELDYIQWILTTKKAMVGRLKYEHKAISNQLKEVRIAIKNIKGKEFDTREEMRWTASNIRALWDEPLDRIEREIKRIDAIILEMDPDDEYHMWKEYKNEAGKNLKRYKNLVKSCHDTQDYSNIDTYKSKRDNSYQELVKYSEKMNPIAPYKAEKFELNSEKYNWRTRRKMILEQFMKLQIKLLRSN
ncbi:Uncharacterised protein [Mycobacteroides abscessus subsp. abscessus]|nr:Uncharacterised protein [Mycobacteroides abscessus subsp. abscessus]